jgi:DNA ligase-1
MLGTVPLSFMAYDILFRDGRLLLDAPIEERRALLDEIGLLTSSQFSVRSHDDIDALFHLARERGNEGLLLKRRGSRYESGKRSGEWLKVKRPFATLDVVITAAEQGNGKRATMFSDYTFAIRDGERFLNVGKAYSGLTDEEIRELTRMLRASTIERYGRVILVRPEIVLEVAFDGVQKSPRHKSGYALRFPRIVAWRRDKRPEECDDLERVRTLYEDSLNLTAARE